MARSPHGLLPSYRRLLAINPMDGVDTPYEADFLLPDEAVRLLDAIRESEYELPILVGLYGGLRPSEYLVSILPKNGASIKPRAVHFELCAWRRAAT